MGFDSGVGVGGGGGGKPKEFEATRLQNTKLGANYIIIKIIVPNLQQTYINM